VIRFSTVSVNEAPSALTSPEISGMLPSLNRLVLPVLTLLLSCLSLAHAEPAKDRHVILISIDGFPAYLWNDPTLQVPNLRKLAADGASAKAKGPL